MILTRRHHRRLRDVYRSSGWPCLDMLEVELLDQGLLARLVHADGRETVRVTDRGLTVLAEVFASNKAARSAHEALVDQVAREMCRAGRIAWRGLSLRALVPAGAGAGPEAKAGPEPRPGPEAKAAPEPRPGPEVWLEEGAGADPGAERGVWRAACPDVFSIRNTTVEAWIEPIVHEVKVSRADLLGDLKKPAKRAAYLGVGGECWYVLGTGANGKPIAAPWEIPPECGVMQSVGEALQVLRPAPRRPVGRLPLHVWMALAKATPVSGLTGDEQGRL